MIKLNEREKELFGDISAQLGVHATDLYKLINFESGWNPSIKNPLSAARGLLQFTDKTAVRLGFLDSLDLVTKNPTIMDQLAIEKRYLGYYAPFRNKQDLYLSVFYPAARRSDPLSSFPEYVQKVNPGIHKVIDYVNRVEGIVGNTLSTVALIAAGFFFSFF